MKILHVSRAIGEFSYHESIIRHLCARGHEVEALFDPMYSKQGTDTALQRCLAETPGLSIGWSVRPRSVQRRALVAIHELTTFGSYVSRDGQSAHYLNNWEQRMPAPLRQLVGFGPTRTLVTRPGVRRALRGIGYRLPPDPEVVASIRQSAPHVVVASPTNMRFSYEAAYVQAALALGIRTVVPVFSWDNLTNKGLYPVIPDLVLAWNPTHAREAVAVHGVPEERVVITGSPFFDKWFSSMHIRPRPEPFLEKVGLDPGRPFICYLGSTDNVAPNEVWLVQAILEAFRTSADPRMREFQILVRPHPRNAAIFEKLEDRDVRIWPRAGALPDSAETLADFSASLEYATAVVGVNTTGMLDAIVADRPVITVLTDRYRRTQAATSHFKHLLDAEVLEVVEDPAAVVPLVGEIQSGRDAKREARRSFVQEFIRPHGLETPAGEIAASIIESGRLDRVARRTAA